MDATIYPVFSIKAIDKNIVSKLNSITADGWELVQVSTGTQSPSDKNSQGIFLTRYFFKKRH